MKHNKKLFDNIAEEVAKSPRLQMNYDLVTLRTRVDSECSIDTKPNAIKLAWIAEVRRKKTIVSVLLPGTTENILRHNDTNEVVFCVYGSVIEHFFDEKSNLTENTFWRREATYMGFISKKKRFQTKSPNDKTTVVITTQICKYFQSKV